MSLLKRIEMDEVLASAHCIWFDKSIADAIAQEAVQIMNQVYSRKITFFNGRSCNSIVGGLFYILGHRHNAVMKQRELADKLGSTDITIRASYRKWMTVFPDLFLDVIAKFAGDSSLKYFVLLDLKKSCSQLA
jgi:transcription initiation factor TFIIIB Brf1 subunit/transcription initiation factor TFIIB